jgi:glycerophosphoryl diester phosphodiesterase
MRAEPTVARKNQRSRGTKSRILNKNPDSLWRQNRALILGAAAAGILAHPDSRKVAGQFFRWWYEIFQGCQSAADLVTDDPFLVIGHRGSAGKEIENTIRSFETAIEEDGANAVETDLCMTSDGEIILWHDWDPMEARALGRGLRLEPDVRCSPCTPVQSSPYCKPVHQLTLDEVRKNFNYVEKESGEPLDAEIPTLEQFMSWAITKPSLKYVFLDMKIPKTMSWIVPSMLARIKAIEKKFNPQFEIVYMTPYLSIMRTFERYYPGPNYIFDIEPPPGIILDPCSFTSVKMAIKWKNAFADTVHPKISTFAPWTTFRRIIECDLRQRKRHNATNPEVPVRKVIGCTLNREFEIKCTMSLGIDGIMSDYPAKLRSIATKMGKRLE